MFLLNMRVIYVPLTSLKPTTNDFWRDFKKYLNRQSLSRTTIVSSQTRSGTPIRLEVTVRPNPPSRKLEANVQIGNHMKGTIELMPDNQNSGSGLVKWSENGSDYLAELAMDGSLQNVYDVTNNGKISVHSSSLYDTVENISTPLFDHIKDLVNRRQI